MARASASVRACQQLEDVGGRRRRRRPSGRSPGRPGRAGWRSRRAAGGAARAAASATSSRSKPMRAATRRRAARPPRCGRPGRALADVVQQGGDEQQVGPAHPRGSARTRLDGRLQHVPVDGAAVHGVALRPVPDQRPLGQQPVDQAGLVERLPHRHGGWPGAEQGRRTGSRARRGHGVRQRRAAAASRSTGVRRERQPGPRGARPPAAAAARVALRRAARASTASPSCSTSPRPSGARSTGPAPAQRSAVATARVAADGPAPGDVRGIGHRAPPRRPARSSVVGVGQAELGRDLVLLLQPRRSVDRPVTRCSASRTSRSRRTASSTSRCGRSATQDAATARSDGDVAQAAAALLQVGLEAVRAGRPGARPRSSQPRAARAAAAGAARQSARTLVRSRPTAGSPATCRASSRPSRTCRSSLGQPAGLVERAHRVVEAHAGVPDRVPEARRRGRRRDGSRSACSSTRSRSLPGESSPRP